MTRTKCIMCVCANVVALDKEGKVHNLMLLNEITWRLLGDAGERVVKRKLLSLKGINFYVDIGILCILFKKSWLLFLLASYVLDVLSQACQDCLRWLEGDFIMWQRQQRSKNID